jgi:thymidylate synthase (FAD)
MKVIQASYEILTDLSDPVKILKNIERAGRTCYKSENNITDDSCIKFCKMLCERGHEAAIEHAQLSVKFIIDRGISHELVRHRLASFCQSSTRYCNYSKDKFGNEITVITPEELMPVLTPQYNIWLTSCKQSEKAYFDLLNCGVKPEIARNVLPTSLMTEIVVTANIREWRTIFKLRTTAFAHPKMRSIMCRLLDDLKSKIPVLFDDITY